MTPMPKLRDEMLFPRDESFFSTATMESTSVVMFKAALGNPKFKKNSDGTSTLTGIRVFKEGTFRDSMGMQRTWEAIHLEQMVNHFKLLRDNKILQDVPVREGHPSIFGSGGAVVGYITDVRHEKGFLLADLEFTEPDATGKWDRGTYRARSLEVGMYETNAEAAYWPVVFGLAFVDIGAVEGLYEKHQQRNMHFSQVMVDDKEALVGEENNQPTNTPEGEGTPPPAPAQPATPPTPAPAPAPEPAPQPAQPTGETGGTPAPSNNQNSAAATATFTINGRPTTDPAQVQTHISTLEKFAQDTQDANRKAFVTGLAAANKITAPQVESLTVHALSLTAEQYTSFVAAYEAAPPTGVLGNHGVQTGGTPPPAGGNDPAEQISILEETLSMHRKAGMSEDKLKETDTFKKLQVLRQSASAA